MSGIGGDHQRILASRQSKTCGIVDKPPVGFLVCHVVTADVGASRAAGHGLFGEDRMRIDFAALFLAAAALFFAVTSLSSGLAPERFAGRLGLAIANPGGVNEIRAQYAGFFLAGAIVCLGALLGWAPRSSAFLFVAATFGGLIAGRLGSLALNGGVGGFPPTILVLYGIDATGFVLSLVFLLGNSRT
jgi:hypothetical protein